MSNRTVNQVMFNPMDLGVGVASFDFDLGGFLLSAAGNSNPFGVSGYNQMRIHWEMTYGAATDISFYVSDKPEGGSAYGPGRFGVVDPTVDPVTASYYRQQIVLPNMGTAANRNGHLDIPINCLGNLRFDTITGSAATTDRVKLWVTLGVV